MKVTAFHLATEGHPRGCTSGGFYRQKGEARELLTTEKEGSFFRSGYLLWEREWQGFLSCQIPFLSMGSEVRGIESVHVTYYLCN